MCINLGGDVHVSGVSPAGTAWSIAVEHPHQIAPLATLGLCEGAVATSTTLCRQWEVDGETRHHLIDPTTGEPSQSSRTFVSVVAGHAWAAEVMAKVLLLRPDADPAAVLSHQASALFVDRDGRIERTTGFDEFERAVAPDASDLEAVG